MAHSLASIGLITFACGVPFGLLLRSVAEARHSPEPRLFVIDGVMGLLATIVEKGLIVLTLFFAPSLSLLWLVDSMPDGPLEMRAWVIANLLGMALGKLIRWLRWRRTQDFM